MTLFGEPDLDGSDLHRASQIETLGGMNIGLFGGSFDPVHRGHIALARSALELCHLSRIYFVPANLPPHKEKQSLSPFLHRYAMVVLATAPEKMFIPSLLEAPAELNGAQHNGGRGSKDKSKQKERVEKPNYTIDTVRRLKESFKASDKLFLLVGIDAFKEIATWHQAETLFRECEFIVASRPGYSLADVANALPERLRPRPEVTHPFRKQAASGDLVLNGATIHLLDQVQQPVSATAIRQAVATGKPLGRFVDPVVSEYIKKVGLYKGSSATHFVA